MLTPHLCDVEARLLERLATLGVGAAADQQAALRDSLVRDFLDPLFGGELAMEAGEVIDNRSKAEEVRPCFDVVLVQRHGLRFKRVGAPTAFPAESVVATLSVVPVLDEAAIRRKVDSALPAIPCHLLAFDCPAPLAQVHIWLKTAHRETGLVEPDMPDSGRERCRIASPALDGIFVLGRGFMNFDNMPGAFVGDEVRKTAFGAVWAVADTDRGAVYSLYLQLQLAAIAMAGLRFDPRPYTGSFPLRSLRFAN